MHDQENLLKQFIGAFARLDDDDMNARAFVNPEALQIGI